MGGSKPGEKEMARDGKAAQERKIDRVVKAKTEPATAPTARQFSGR